MNPPPAATLDAPPDLTVRLARFAADVHASDLAPETLDKTRMAILDAVGCGVAGCRDPAVEILVQTAAADGDGGRCPILGRPETFTPRAAALITGTMIHVLEMDDTHSFSSVHAGGPVVAASLAAFRQQAADDDTVLAAVAAGYEIACRLGTAIRGPSPYHRGFHPTGICGVFGAATACGKLFGLDSDGFRRAWGIAGSMAGGLMAYLQNGAWTKKLHPGWAAQAGLTAARLAAGGFLGPDDIFGGQYNFCRAYADAFDGAALGEQLGTRFEIGRMSYKPFACCRTIHAPITAALALRRRPGFDARRIERIYAHIADEDLDLVVEPLERKRQPRTLVEAQFSMPFGVALALTAGAAGPAQYTRRHLDDPLIRALAQRFEYRLEDDYTRRRPLYFPCRLDVEMAGRVVGTAVDAPLGDFTNPMSNEQMIAKFRALAGPVLGHDRAQELERTVLDLGRKKSRPGFGRLAGLAVGPGKVDTSAA